jgi:hypothetical protein
VFRRDLTSDVWCAVNATAWLESPRETPSSELAAQDDYSRGIPRASLRSVNQPQLFIHSRAVGEHVGLTPKRYQSGEVDCDSRVSKCGDVLLRRRMLYEAAHSLLTRSRK